MGSSDLDSKGKPWSDSAAPRFQARSAMSEGINKKIEQMQQQQNQGAKP
jgi:hypothetical protein